MKYLHCRVGLSLTQKLFFDRFMIGQVQRHYLLSVSVGH